MTLHMTCLAQCGSADITMKQVLDRFGKRLIIVVTELDTGKWVQDKGQGWGYRRQ